ncbi:MAG: hypothetical protein RLZZ04_508 [Cyanobacteriota bacterium]|jgi:hypothetical protein
MSEIKIQDLSTQNVPGMDLFNDSENFMIELNDEQDQNILGGMRCEGAAKTGCYGGSGWCHSDFAATDKGDY